MYDSVLIPTDGSDPARRAATHGLYLAAAFDATVHVVCVVDVQDAAGPFSAGGVDDEFVDRLDASGRDTIDEIEALADGTGTMETAVVKGTPRKAILEYADEAGIDLIAMGTHGRSGVRRFVTGSVCEHVVRRAKVPVVTVRRSERSEKAGEYEDVLIPTDGSDAADAAVEHGIAVAAATGATVHAVNVVDVRGISASSGPGFDDVLRRQKSRGRDAAEAIAEQARAASLDAETSLLEGAPADSLLTYVDDNGVDFVAMGTTGRTGLDRFLLGSTAERVIRRASVPVLSVNTGGQAGK